MKHESVQIQMQLNEEIEIFFIVICKKLKKLNASEWPWETSDFTIESISWQIRKTH